MDVNGTAPEPDDQAPEPGCSWCERGSGTILLIGAIGLAYIGLDLLTGGRLSQLFVSKVTAAADAIDPAGAEGITADEPSA